MKEDENVLGQLIRILNRVERSQQADWPSIRQKIALCNGVTCGDTLILDAREGDSLLVNVNINGELFNLIAYRPAVTSSYFFVWIMSTSSIWGVLLVGMIGFLWSYKKRSGKLEKKTFMWSAFFGGPIISYSAHLSEIRRSGKSYLWVVFGICVVPRIVVNGINRAIEYAADKLIINPYYVDGAYYAYCSLETLMIVAFNLFMAFVAAQRFWKICPYCDIDDYNKMERKGVIVGVVFWLIFCLPSFLLF